MARPPFLSSKPSAGSSCGEDFRSPRLLQFSGAAHLRWKKFLGAGEDGFVIQATTDTSQLAIKFFYHSRPPPAHPHQRYWALERECRVASLLAMMQKASQQRNETGRPAVYINPEPKTHQDALANLAILSGECCDENLQSNRRKPLTLNIRTSQCFGWFEVQPRIVLALFKKLPRKEYKLVPQLQRACDGLDGSERYVAVVYEYVPEGDLDAEIVQRHLDFFYLAGFGLMPFREQNWRGNVLVDHSDLIPPHIVKWWKPHYGRMEVGWYLEELRKSSAMSKA
ncbi:hypothetical protein B0T16DRAFT_397138 [Cercophora newfieldiana]|uniref:Uncharacterized protein n=1 Tax=Cercophora newfieldiana TaxID=92897 RepID=A0AA40CYT3_9PEZI|nr:hypothetical protein B0T16DRAFT_397138 [Cercophora newfieldiana]